VQMLRYKRCNLIGRHQAPAFGVVGGIPKHKFRGFSRCVKRGKTTLCPLVAAAELAVYGANIANAALGNEC